MKKHFLTALKVLLFFGLGFAILYLVYRSQNIAFQEQCRLDGIPAEDCSLLQKIWIDFQHANLFWLVLVVFAFLVSNVSRAARWIMLIRPMGYAPRKINAFLVIMLGYFANLGLPRLGEVVRAGVFARYEDIPAEKVMGTVVTDRAIDFLSLLIFLAAAFLLEFDLLWGWLVENVRWDRFGIDLDTWIRVGIIGFLILLALVWQFRKALLQSVFIKKVIRLLHGFWEGIRTVGQVDRPGWFLFHSVNIWLMYYLMAYLCFFAFEPTSSLSPVAGLMVFVFGSFGIVIPSPGGMGTYHFLVIAALALYGISGDDAFSLANIIFFTIQVFGNILFGIIALILLPIYNREYQPPERALQTS